MYQNYYCPEGTLLDTLENQTAIASIQGMKQAQISGKILEARVLTCDSSHNMWVDLPCMKGMIPREEGAVGIAEGEIRDIALIARVGKPVCFKVICIEQDEDGNDIALLSRRAVQEQCQAQFLSKLHPGDIIPAKVTHLEPFGAFVDIGSGVASMVPIDAISVSRITHPADRFTVGQNIRVIIRGMQGNRVILSHKELLGTWEENAGLFHVGETTCGTVRSVEKYGVFIELTPNLAGLAELRQPVEVGQRTSVYIKALIPEKMKIKLILVDICDKSSKPDPLHYFYQGDHIDHWIYTPANAKKYIDTVFDGNIPEFL